MALPSISLRDSPANVRGLGVTVAMTARAVVGTTMANAIGRRGDDSLTPTIVVRNYFSDYGAREEFSATICKFTAPQLAKASHCSTDAAKKWIAGRSSPNLANTIN